MTNDTNKIKLLALWDILCKNTDENHAMNSDEIREELAKRGISVMRKVVATDIAALNKYGYEVLSYSDVTVRRLVEYIRVMKDNSIIIVLKGGIQIREPIETYN